MPFPLDDSCHHLITGETDNGLIRRYQSHKSQWDEKGQYLTLKTFSGSKCFTFVKHSDCLYKNSLIHDAIWHGNWYQTSTCLNWNGSSDLYLCTHVSYTDRPELHAPILEQVRAAPRPPCWSFIVPCPWPTHTHASTSRHLTLVSLPESYLLPTSPLTQQCQVPGAAWWSRVPGPLLSWSAWSLWQN